MRYEVIGLFVCEYVCDCVRLCWKCVVMKHVATIEWIQGIQMAHTTKWSVQCLTFHPDNFNNSTGERKVVEASCCVPQFTK